MPNEFMSTEEVMSFLGIARSTLYKYADEGKLTVYKSKAGSRRSFYKREQVEELKKNLTSYVEASELEPVTYQPNEDELIEIIRRIEANDGRPGIPHEAVKAEFNNLRETLRKKYGSYRASA